MPVSWNVVNHEDGPCKVNLQVSSSLSFATESEAREHAKKLSEAMKFMLYVHEGEKYE